MARLEPENRNLYQFLKRVQVRWGDMDALGHVNNAVYFMYFEISRIAYFEHIGADKIWTEEQGPIIANAHCDYLKPITYPSDLVVGTRCSRIGNSSFDLTYAAYEEGADQPLAQGSTVAVWMDYKKGGTLPLPPSLKESFI